jgi:hypothetical protein
VGQKIRFINLERKKSMTKRYYFIVSVFLISSCTNPTAKFIIPNYEEVKPQKIAVLPLTNETTDLDGPVMIRNLMKIELFKNGYDTLETAAITTALKNEGITDAGQLKTISREELNQILSADAVLYGELLNFRHLLTGVYNERAVKTGFELVALANGDTLWNDNRQISNKEIGSTPFGIIKGLIWGTGKRIYEKSRGLPLYPESKELVATHLATLPWGPNRTGYPPWLWNNPNLKLGSAFIFGYPSIIGVQLKAWQSCFGAQADFSVMPSARILYSPIRANTTKFYLGARLGYDTYEIWSDENEDHLSISPFMGFEWLHWQYSSYFRSHSFSLNLGWTFQTATGPFIEISNGFYFK